MYGGTREHARVLFHLTHIPSKISYFKVLIVVALCELRPLDAEQHEEETETKDA